MDKVGNAIKERRKILKITQRTLAELAGVGINTLTKIERGEGNPTIEDSDDVSPYRVSALHLTNILNYELY